MSAGPNQRLLAWQAAGTTVIVDRRRILVRRTVGDGPLLVFLHGFPSSSYDWRTVLPSLLDRPTLALDFLGLSDKPPDAVYGLFTQADIVQRLIGAESARVLVVAHDMGTSVATQLLARDLEAALDFELAGVPLLNGGMIVERASLTWAQQALRSPLGPIVAPLSTRPVFHSQFSRLFSPAHALSVSEAEDQWTLWLRAGGNQLAHRLIHYIDERRAYASCWHGGLVSAVAADARHAAEADTG
jgi:pimeloyl-ACP methyl ester carboxylesterase